MLCNKDYKSDKTNHDLEETEMNFQYLFKKVQSCFERHFACQTLVDF